MSVCAEVLLLTLDVAAVIVAAASVTIVHLSGSGWWLALLIPLYITVNLVPGIPRNLPSLKLRMTHHGVEALRVFLWSSLGSLALQIYWGILLLPSQWGLWVAGVAVGILAEGIVFLNGIVSVYATSTQLGVRRRVIGLLLGWIPLINIGILLWIIGITALEVNTESGKVQTDSMRHDQHICATRYPILLVHGVFFRDTNLLNYWGAYRES